MAENSTFLSQGVDHLGFLNGQLRGLMGFTALANELTQNADDAKAQNLVFDVTDEALILENDSMFTECQTVDQTDCSFELLAGHLCDFHRFRRVSSGNKREEENTIGAFGIGFTSVYQITDRPELISGTRHWTIRPEETEDKRIEQKVINEVFFTRFIFPWARNPHSKLRKALSVAAITDKQIEQLFEDIQKAISDTIMFLKRINRIELRRNGKKVKEVIIERKSDRLVVKDAQKTYQWLLFTGDFADKKDKLVNKSITQNRKTEVSIAVPLDNVNVKGLLFAYLPTQETVGLPFHINADFFPTPDRKRILFDDDYQGDWNRLAIEEAADVLSNQLEELTEILGPKGFWNLIENLQKVSKSTENSQYDEIFGEFWETAKDKLHYLNCIYTTQEKWVSPSDAFILQNYKKEKSVIPILEELGLNIVHEDLAKFYNILWSEDVGAEQFGLADLAKALVANNLNNLISVDDAPEWLQNDENREILADEIKYLLTKTTNSEQDRQQIRGCAIAKSCGDNFDTPDTIYKCEESVRTLFFALGLEPYFLADHNPPPITDLVESFSIEAAIEILETVDSDKFTDCLTEKPDDFFKLVKWLVNQCLEKDDETKERLRNLKIWLSGGNLYILDELVVPGGFADPLHLASIIDLETLAISPDKLIEIGAEKLTFQNYITEQLTKFVFSPQTKPEHCRELVKLFAHRRSEIADNQEIRSIIARFPIIECQDKKFRPANSIYFSSDETKQLLGTGKVAYINPVALYSPIIQEFFRWLGVGTKPRLKDVLERIDELVQPLPTNASRAMIQKIFVHLGERWNDLGDKSVFDKLKTKKWLPAKGDPMNWYRPDELFAPYQDYLFETTGRFIDVPRNEIRLQAKYVDNLGIKSTPTTKLVIDHLRNKIKENQPVHNAVYTFLDQQHQDSLVAVLQNLKCIWLDNHYVSPDQVFWSHHPFGSYRYSLGNELRQYKNLFDVLGVKEKFDFDDVIEVLKEISQKFSAENVEVDEENKNIIRHCWLNLNDAPADVLEKLGEIPVILTNSNRLEKPKNLYFDDFPGIAEELGMAQQAIPRPADTWQAMSQAGVKFLSKAVKITLVEATNKQEDKILNHKMSWGQECILRIVEAARQSNEFSYEIFHLSKINFIRTSKLLIKYSIPEISNCESSIIEATAFYDQEKNCFYYPQSAGLNNISRELARSISSQIDVGLLASGIKEILSAENSGQAVQNLNDLGFAIIEFSNAEQPATTTIFALGEEVEQTEDFEETISEEDAAFDEFANEAVPLTGQTEDKTETVGEQPRKFGANLNLPPQTNQSQNAKPLMPQVNPNVGQSMGDNNHKGGSYNRTSSTGERGKSTTSAGNGNSAPNQAKKKPQTSLPKVQGRLLSYVESKSTEKEPKVEDEAKKQRREKLDAAGIQKVLDFERKAGRDPEIMRHNNKGYDIQSWDKNETKIERMIEVKSTSGEWDSYGVKLSDSQFEKCLDEEDRFWLYVVERADQDDARIYCIQNPAAQVTNYCFDSGWKQLDKK